MEIGIDNRIPTYGGGLGILAGDLAFSYADLGLPATFVTQLPREGYTHQRIDPDAGQMDAPQQWDPNKLLTPLSASVTIEIGEKTVRLRAWEYKIRGKTETSVLFLDADHPENDEEVRRASARLYGGAEIPDRFLQDIVLGVGGYRLLKALGREVKVYHLNESHAAFAIVELLRDAGSVEATRNRCRFTTHTPIAAGNDVFPLGSVVEAFRKYPWIDWNAESIDGGISLTRLAAKYSSVTNAVSLKHRFVSKDVLQGAKVTHVTNGVYHRRWVCESMKNVFDTFIPDWEESPSLLVRAMGIPPESIGLAHATAKRTLIAAVQKRAGLKFNEGTLTIGVARRFTGYKRNGMILGDMERLRRIAEEKGEIQIAIAGKAHPRDNVGKEMLIDVVRRARLLNSRAQKVRVAVLENYDIELAKLLVAGCDVWLNVPRRPLEACGTSGMKAAMNGVLNFSVHDGWWLEAGVEGQNGWGIGRRPEWSDLSGPEEGEDEDDLFSKLSYLVLPTYYQNQPRWLEMARASIATVGPLFNSYRMAEDYIARVYSESGSGS